MAGRKAYLATDEARELVRRLSGADKTRAEIAAELAISVPTLAKYHAADLQRPGKNDAPLLAYVSSIAPAPKRRAGGAGGRPEFQPSDQQRRDVALFLADGWSKADICSVLNLTPPTLEKHFEAELRHGAVTARAENLRRLRSAAASGKVAAMKTLQDRFDTVESAGKTPQQPGALAKPKEDTPGKKALATRAAHDAASTGPWAELLGQQRVN